MATRAWPRGHGRRWTRRRARCCDRSVVHRERAQSVESFPRPLKACPSRLEHPATGCSRRSGDASDGLQVLSNGAASPATPTARSSLPVWTRVRATDRGLAPLDGGATAVLTGKSPSRGPNPRPDSHGSGLSGDGSPGFVVVVRRGWDREAWVGAAPGFSRAISLRSQRKPSAQPTRYVHGPYCPISESRRGFACHCNGNLVSDQHGMSGDELGTNRLEPRENPAIPTNTRPQTNTKCPIGP